MPLKLLKNYILGQTKSEIRKKYNWKIEIKINSKKVKKYP